MGHTSESDEEEEMSMIPTNMERIVARKTLLIIIGEATPERGATCYCEMSRAELDRQHEIWCVVLRDGSTARCSSGNCILSLRKLTERLCCVSGVAEEIVVMSTGVNDVALDERIVSWLSEHMRLAHEQAQMLASARGGVM